MLSSLNPVSGRLFILPLLSTLLSCSGGSSSSTVTTQPITTPNAMSFSQIGPQGGFMSSVAFHPTQTGVIWASGDDGAGLYLSTDMGTTWKVVQTGSQNQSTYSLRFDPANPNTIFAPNHFGRGMLKSTDGGVTWNSAQAGLPISGSSTQALSDLAVNPSNSSIVFVATDSGLYKSLDGGASFSLNATTLAGGTGVRSLAFRQDGVLFIGKSDGALGYTGDGGVTWTQLLAPSGISLDVIAFSNTLLYLGYRNAAIYRLDKTNFSGSVLINNPSQMGSIQNANRLSLVVKSGATAGTDLVLVGTWGASSFAASQWGLFKSTNGGTTWGQLTGSLTGESIMAVAVDPGNSNNLVVGSGSGHGLFRSTDGGTTWTGVTKGLISTASLGLAQDPSNASHLLASNTACGGFSINFETTDGGTTWSSFSDPVADDGIFAFDLDPASSQNVLAGTCTKGILRSSTGTAGSWSVVQTTAGQRVDRFVRDLVYHPLVYAVVPSGDANHSLYVSTNGGSGFAPAPSITAYNIAVHPSHAAELIVSSNTDVFASTDSFATQQHSLGLSPIATSDSGAQGGFTAVAYNPANPQEVVVCGASGGIYKTLNYNAGGVGVNWTKLSSPIVAASPRDIVIANRGGETVYYVATAAGDTGVKTGSTPGVFRSLDGGNTWTLISGGLFPSSLPWRMISDLSSPSTSFLLGMWAGGLYRLTDTQ